MYYFILSVRLSPVLFLGFVGSGLINRIPVWCGPGLPFPASGRPCKGNFIFKSFRCGTTAHPDLCFCGHEKRGSDARGNAATAN